MICLLACSYRFIHLPQRTKRREVRWHSMECSTDPYELKLFQMFQCCDTEHCGYLDEVSLKRLCTMLELRNKGAVLIDGLTARGKISHVTFENFKEALLSFLGTELEDNHNETAHSDTISSVGRIVETTNTNDETNIELSLVIGGEDDGVEELNERKNSNEVSRREISPKLIVGSKKYGRRSRPIVQNGGELLTSSNSDDSADETTTRSHRNCLAVQRSSSQSDIPGSRTRSTAKHKDSKLKRCASLPAQRNLQNKTGLANHNTRICRDSQLTNLDKQLSSSLESLGTPALIETLPTNRILELWESAQVPNGSGILAALGFHADEVNLAQLSKVMEEEMGTSLEEEPQLSLMKACLVLQSAELGALRQSARQLCDENAKLRADNKDSNRRIALFTAEIDEIHASIEDSTKKEIRLLEKNHASVVRELSQRLATDRENWANLNARLEARIKTFEQNEIKLKTELELIVKENEELLGEQQRMRNRIHELQEMNDHLNGNLNEMVGRQHMTQNQPKNTAKDTHEEELLRLMEKVNAVQLENTKLRDKNDELAVEVEALHLELNKMKIKSKKFSINDELKANEKENAKRAHSFNATEQLEHGSRQSTSETGYNSGEWTALDSELNIIKTDSLAKQREEEVEALKERLKELETLLRQDQAEKITTGSPPPTPTPPPPSSLTAEDRCRELENSLEQMQRAYEDCEDYWQAKLSEERALYEKERQIYEEEQQENDKKFTELMEKVREYEEQFSKDGRLSPIEEKDQLEQQYAELEAEVNDVRNNTQKIIEDKSQEIEALKNEIKDLRSKLGETVDILTVCELNAENVTASTTNFVESTSSANSPISYLWQQSTIQTPAKNCESLSVANNTALVNNNLSTSETTTFSTPSIINNALESATEKAGSVGKTQSIKSETGDVADCETSSTTSSKSFETHSMHSARNVQQKPNNSLQQMRAKSSTINTKNTSPSPSPNGLKEELKRLKYFELSLREQIKNLSIQRDGLIMELQQLQEAKPVLEKAYARTAHPSLIQRVNQLELKNRHLQNVIKQQQQYNESVMQQSWRQHQIELNDLHGRLESQSVLVAEQTQRLQSADILVKDLYVENSHLAAAVQRLEQQRFRVNLIQQQQQQQQQQARTGCSGLPGMP